MNKKKESFGIIIICIGVIWLLCGLNLITWNVFGGLVKLFPLVFVVIGINIIFKNNYVVKTLTWITFIIVVVVYSYFVKDYKHPYLDFKFRHHNEYMENKFDRDVQKGISKISTSNNL